MLRFPKKLTPTEMRSNRVIPIDLESPLADNEENIRNAIGHKTRQIKPYHLNAKKPRTMLDTIAIGPEKNANHTIISSKYGDSPVLSLMVDTGISV